MQDRAERGNAALHDLIETHQTLAFITAGLLAVIVLWRVACAALSRNAPASPTSSCFWR